MNPIPQTCINGLFIRYRIQNWPKTSFRIHFWLHHSEALNHYWKDKEKLTHFVSGYKNVGLNGRETLLCDFAERLTSFPEQFNDDSVINTLKENDFSDSAILDATLVISYFNFVNRIVLALGVETNDAERQGYKF